MKILISYHHFVRDFRGSLLLRYVLKALGHSVWLTPHWNRDTELAALQDSDVIVGCQIAEHSQAYIADFAAAAGIHLVINSSEQFTSPDRQESLITYDCDRVNDEVIAFQSIACPKLFAHIQQHPRIRHKERYGFIGFPRFDLSLDPALRSVETPGLTRRYALPHNGRRLLYLSSLLFEESFADVPAKDMDRWDYGETIARNTGIANEVVATLEGLVRHTFGPKDVLLVKKHPWDLSSRLERALRHPQVIFLADDEYVVPCIDAADVVLHSFSTAAIEAWAMAKPTIAILPRRFRPALNLVHMNQEVMAEDLDEAIHLLEHYPADGPRSLVDALLGGLTDGRATVRLAMAIDRLPAPVRKRLPRLSVARRFRGFWRESLRELGLHYPRALPEDSRLARLAQWERSRIRLARLYAPYFRRYVERHRDHLCPPFQAAG